MDAAPPASPTPPRSSGLSPAEQSSGLVPLAVIRSYDDLLMVARARMAALNITFEVLDSVSGVQLGYSAKLISGRTRRRFGNVSLAAVFGGLGLQLVVCEDPAALAQIQHRLTPRMRPRVNRAA
jgi:hypothetical protein